jgi:hypothetical protein
MRRFDRYRVADDDEVQADYFNGVHEDLDLRIHAVEEKAVGWEEEVARFEDVALGRIDAALLPILEQAILIRDRIETAAHLGTILSAQSPSQVSVALGIKTFVVRPEDRLRFAPAGFLVVVSEAQPANWLVGRLNDYDADSGTLSVLVTDTGGAGLPPIRSLRLRFLRRPKASPPLSRRPSKARNRLQPASRRRPSKPRAPRIPPTLPQPRARNQMPQRLPRREVPRPHRVRRRPQRQCSQVLAANMPGPQLWRRPSTRSAIPCRQAFSGSTLPRT